MNKICAGTSTFTSTYFVLSFVHYNVQSIYTKLELLRAELIQFDKLAFYETWLNHSVDTEDFFLESKDRGCDSHGGVIIYVKEGIYYNIGMI